MAIAYVVEQGACLRVRSNFVEVTDAFSLFHLLELLDRSEPAAEEVD